MKKFIAIMLSLLLVITWLGGCSSNQGTEAKKETLNLRFPTASTTGAVYPLGAALANLWNNNIEGINVSAEASNGGVQNLNLMADGDADISVAVTSIITEQRQGINAFEGRPYDGVRILTSLYANYNQVVVRKGIGFDSYRDIKGKTFAVGAPGSTMEVETKNHTLKAGLKYPDDFKAQFVGPTESLDLLRNKQIDGFFMMAGIPTAAVTEALATADAKILSIEEDIISTLQAEYPWYIRAVIPAGTYDGQDEDVVTTAIKIMLICDESVPEDVAYNLVKVMWENIDSLKATNKVVENMKLEDAAKDTAGIPLHPGAERYYKEKGVL
ncbi:MAG: TAXI family TRAP transporter solute-binding subunit [Clostridia bacterium]|nr:TAXI family TRAP transporter solute-binding subunit [Clostridia bacterium]